MSSSAHIHICARVRVCVFVIVYIQAMDPQIKLTLLCAWEAVVDRGGQDLRQWHNAPVGVYIGGQVGAGVKWNAPYGAKQFDISGFSLSMISNRVSFHMNLTGPSFTVNTACSSAATAAHVCMQGLQMGECKAAVMGSTQFLGNIETSIAFNLLGVISPTGRCHSFDAQANGYMRSEGSSVFVLKDRAQAERDGDPLFLAVLATGIGCAGSEENAPTLAQGRTITKPVSNTQAELMADVLKLSQRDPSAFDFLEAHSTGTIVGDAVEGEAISRVFGNSKVEYGFLRVASTRSNIGHQECASFAGSLLKVLMMYQRRTFYPMSSNFKSLNPDVPFDDGTGVSPIRVQTEAEAFPTGTRKVLTAINSFGFGGAYGSCVVEEVHRAEPPETDARHSAECYHAVPVSAKSTKALQMMAKNYATWMSSKQNTVPLGVFAANLWNRRTAFQSRKAFIAKSFEDLASQLESFADEAEPTVKRAADSTTANRPITVFPGQGSSWEGMGKALYEEDPGFRATVDLIDVYWQELSGSKLSEATFDFTGDVIHEPINAQPCSFLVQAALFDTIRARGLEPAVVLGHSAGEAVAAYASGAYTLKETCYLVYHRSVLQQSLSGSGRMLVVLGITLDAVQEIMASEDFSDLDLEIACKNSPTNTVLSGPDASVYKAKELLDAKQIKAKLIRGTTAFHSKHTEPIKDPLMAALETLGSRTPKIPLISTVTGQEVTELDYTYWWSNVREAVSWTAAIEYAVEHYGKGSSDTIFFELSPHPTLVAPTKDSFATCTYVTTMDRKAEPGSFAVENAMAKLFEAGVDFARKVVEPSIAHVLPTYPFVEERVFNDTCDTKFPFKLHRASAGPLLGERLDSGARVYRTIMNLENYKYMQGHSINGAVLLPAAGYLEILIEAFGGQRINIVTMDIGRPCEIKEHGDGKGSKFVETHITPMGRSETFFRFKICSRESRGQDVEHVSGKLKLIDDDKAPTDSEVPTLSEEDRAAFSQTVFDEPEPLYQDLRLKLDNFFQYGGIFKSIKELWVDPSTLSMLCRVELENKEGWDKAGYFLHPALSDGMLQSFAVVLAQYSSGQRGVPAGLLDFTFYKRPVSPSVWVVYRPPPVYRKTLKNGTFEFPLGTISVGSLYVYDCETNDIVARLGSYLSNNTEASFMKDESHLSLSWQSKLMSETGAVLGCTNAVDDLRTLIAEANAQNRLLSIAEVIAPKKKEEENDEAMEDETAPSADEKKKENEHEEEKQCVLILDSLLDELRGKDVQYTVLAEEVETLVDVFDRVSSQYSDAMLRFQKVDESSIEKMRGSFDIIVRTAETESPTMMLLAPRGYALNVSCDAVPGWEAVSSSSSDAAAGYVVQRKPMEEVASPILDASQLAPASMEEESVAGQAGETADTKPEVEEVVHAEVSVVGSNAFADAFRVNDTCVQAFQLLSAGAPHYIFFGSLDDETNEDGTTKDASNLDRHGAAWKLIDWVTDTFDTGSMDSTTQGTIVVVTKGAIGGNGDVDPRMRAVWGAARSIREEVAGLSLVIVDLSSLSDVPAMRHLPKLGEDELAIRDAGASILCSRFRRESGATVTTRPDGYGYTLNVSGTGNLDDLRFDLFQLKSELSGDDVEIEVRASALNFRDIMVSLSRLPFLSYERSGLGKTVGMECAGVVRRVGPDVTDFKVGDPVMAMGPALITSTAVLPQTRLMRVPDGIPFERAAGFPSVYITAHLALVQHAGMRRGQTVLIHSALGGVGIAAINISLKLGATIYATAGTEEKRAKLRAMGCAGVFDSHSLSWYDELMHATNMRGVDIVLNSLAGEHLDLCLEALAAGGIHCEIGKVDVFADRPMHMLVMRKNLRLAIIDVDRLTVDDLDLVQKLFVDSSAFYRDGELVEMPITVFPYADFDKAMRFMMKGSHVGKIVLMPPTGADGESGSSPLPCPVRDVRHLYAGWPKTAVMTGAFGGIGVKTFAYLAQSGVTHFLLIDRDPRLRRTPKWICDQAGLTYALGDDVVADADDAAEWRLRIRTQYVDIADAASVKAALDPAHLASIGLPPCGVVVHLAGVVDDKYLMNVTEDSLKYVFSSKVSGAVNLHEACKDQSTVEQFVVFSSVVSTIGNASQATYAAANSFVDGLVEHRRASGLPAVSYNMAAVMDAGAMASQNHTVLRSLIASGMRPISTIEALRSMDLLLRESSERSHMVSFAATRFHPSLRDARRTGHLAGVKESFTLRKEGGEMTHESVVQALTVMVCKVCEVESVEVNSPVSDLGLNSVSVVELVNDIQAEFDVEISPMKLMTGATIESIADTVLAAAAGEADGGGEDGAGGADGASRSIAVGYPVGEQMDAYVDGLPKAPRQDFDRLRYKLKSKAAAIKAQPGFDHPECMLPSKKHIFVTGATGFLGRFLVKYLCESLAEANDTETRVLCLVRSKASDETSGAAAEDGMQRLRKAMEEADVWNDAFASSIGIVEGSIQAPRFGLDEDSYNELAGKVESIYHFAADISLFKPYEEIRVSNATGMINVLDFCFAGRQKELHYAGTLGIFPQYISGFLGRYEETTIGPYERPALADMKCDFPMAIIGYPWSKLVCELMIEEARTRHGLRANMYRLPLTYMAYETGFVQMESLFSRLLHISIQTGLLPAGSATLELVEECGALTARMVADIGRNASRKHWVYNCFPSKVSEALDARDGLDMASSPQHLSVGGFGVSSSTLSPTIKMVGYREFRKTLYPKTAEFSALEGQWGVLDFFSRFWFRDSVDEEVQVPHNGIDVSNAVEDLVTRIETPSDNFKSLSVLGWLGRHQSELPMARDALEHMREHGLPFDERVGFIDGMCELAGVERADALPAYAEANLRSLVAAVDTPEKRAALQFSSHFDFWMMIRIVTENRIQLHRAHSGTYAEAVGGQVIDRPVFIVGLNRTGTTFLHQLVHSSGAVAGLTLREQLEILDPDVVATGDTSLMDRRGDAAAVREWMAGSGAGVAVRAQHEGDLGLDVVEEDIVPFIASFSSPGEALSYDVHDAHFVGAEQRGLSQAYVEHKRWTQYHAWRRQMRGEGRTDRWLFKYPFHMRYLADLFAAYPDAIVVRTHRPLADVMPSWLTMVSDIRAGSLEASYIDKMEIGREQLAFCKESLARADAFRREHPEKEAQFVDVNFQDLITDPLGIAKKICEKAGIDIDQEKEERMSNFVNTFVERNKHMQTKEKTQLEDFGLTAADC